MNPILVISCEHASKQIPTEYTHLFADQQQLLDSHRGWDIGAYTLYQAIESTQLATQAIAAQWSRLLVDLNRSIKNKNLLSSITKILPKNERMLILKNYYFPYREWLMANIFDYYTKKIPVIHLSLHSFTPELNGQLRNSDIGLLYNPKCLQEKKFCEILKSTVDNLKQNFRIRLNYPYRGISDGFTTFLRRQIPNNYYLGIEIEMNQKHFDLEGNCKTSLIDVIVIAIELAVSDGRITLCQ